jgi:hypothetical protein
VATNNYTEITTAYRFRASELNVPLGELDKAITYAKNVIVHCDGSVTYNSGTGQLAWSGTLRILFNREDGKAIENTVATGNVTLSDNQFAYVDLNETDATALTVYAASVTTDAASNFLAVGRLVLGYRNTASDEYFPVALYVGGSGSGISNVVEDTTPQLGGDLDLNQKCIDISTALGTDLTAVGLIDSVTVDTNATGVGAALYMAADGNYDEADADAAATMPVTTLALETGTGTKEILLQGYIRKDAWSWTPGGLIYADVTTGALSQTAPSGSGDQVQVVGWAKSADILYFNPSLVLVEVV